MSSDELKAAKLDKVLVSESTRRDARESPSQALDRIERERQSLQDEKSRLEAQLFEITQYKRDQTAAILARRLPKTMSIEATTRLEAEVGRRKSPIVAQVKAIEERLFAVKNRAKEYRNARDAGEQKRPSNTEVLLVQIKEVLVDILECVRHRPTN